jgi:hypothetical protein
LILELGGHGDNGDVYESQSSNAPQTATTQTGLIEHAVAPLSVR